MGWFKAEHIRNNEIIDQQFFKNGITTEGANRILDIAFRNQALIPTWYAGLIANSGSPSLAAGDTHASHAGWSELHAEYSQATRPVWTPSAAASRIITNGTAITFDFTTTAAVYGVFLTNGNTKGSTSSSFIIWAHGAFTVPGSYVNGDQLKVTYSTSL